MPVNTAFFVDPVNFEAQPLSGLDASSEIRATDCGPFEIGANLYLLLWDGQRPSATFDTTAYHSIDQGKTWNRLPSTTTTAQTWTSTGAVGTTIWVLYGIFLGGGAGFTLHIIPFNTLTNTWGTSIAMPNPIGGTDFRAWDMTVQTDGTINIFYTLNVATIFNVWIKRYSGGVWGADQQLTTAGWIQTNVFLDSVTNVSHLDISARDTLGSGPLLPTLHLQINSTGAVISQTTILAAPPVAQQDAYPTFGVGCIWNNSIILPYQRNLGYPTTTGASRPAVFIGTPVSAPVWVSVDLPFNDPPGQIVFYQFSHDFAVVDNNGNLNIFWCSAYWDVTFSTVSARLWQSVNTGAGFADAVMYYDSAVDTSTHIPPLGTAIGRSGAFMPSITLLASGAFGITIQMLVDTRGAIGYDMQPNFYIAPVGGRSNYSFSNA